MAETITAQDLLELGFEGFGALLRKHYREFVIDALPDIPGSYTRLELRGGSQGVRICARLESVDELKTLIAVLDRAK